MSTQQTLLHTITTLLLASLSSNSSPSPSPSPSPPMLMYWWGARGQWVEGVGDKEKTHLES